MAPLPDNAFAFVGAAAGNPLALRQASRENRFDLPPARHEIGITFSASSITREDDRAKRQWRRS